MNVIRCVSLSIFWVQLNLHLIAHSFLDTIFFTGISLPLLFTCSWPDSWAFLRLFTIQVGSLIERFLKFGLFFNGCATLSTLSIRSFLLNKRFNFLLNFFFVRIFLIMLLNLSAFKETGSSWKSERKLISLSIPFMITAF